MAREVTPRLLAAGGGRIVNISMNYSTMQRAGFVPQAAGVHGERIVATEFEGWLRDRSGL